MIIAALLGLTTAALTPNVTSLRQRDVKLTTVTIIHTVATEKKEQAQLDTLE